MLQQRLEKRGWKDVVVAKTETGQEFLSALESASKKAPIKNLVAWGHAFPHGIVMKEDEGMYRKRSDLAPKSGAAFLEDLEKRMKAGTIKFSKDATIVLAACNCGGTIDVKTGKATPDSSSFAAELAKLTGARVIASVGGSDQTVAGDDMRREGTMGGWFVFDKQNPEGRALQGCTDSSCKVIQPERLIKKD